MKLKKLIVENYCSYQKHVEIGEFNDVNFIIGKNGTGKSNFYRCLRLFYNIFNGNEEIDINNIYNLDKSKNLVIGFTLDVSKADSKSILSNHTNPDNHHITKITYTAKYDDLLLESESFELTNELNQTNCVYSNSRRINQSQRLNTTDQLLSNNPSLTFTDDMSAQKTLKGYLQSHFPILLESLTKFFDISLMKNDRSIESQIPLRENNTIPINGEGYSSYLNTVQNNSDDKKSKYDQTLTQLTDGCIDKIKSINSESNAQLEIHMQELSSPLKFELMSSGEKQQALFAIVNGIETPVLFIEEPELHLHPSAQKALLRVLKEYSTNTNTQLFIESHSPIFVGCEPGESTCLLSKDNSSTDFIMIDKSNINIIRKELGINYVDIFDHDYFIFVEGKSERHAFNILNKEFNYSQPIHCWNLDGYENAKKLDPLLQYLNNTDRKMLIILDNHEGVQTLKDKLINKRLIDGDGFKILKKSFEDTFDKSTILNTVKKLYGDAAYELINVKYNPDEHVGNILEREIDGKKHDKQYNKVEFAAALTNTIKKDVSNSNEFAQIINNFLTNPKTNSNDIRE